MTTLQTISTIWPTLKRVSAPTKTDMIPINEAKTAGWTMVTQTVFDEDSGVESLRVTHTYTGYVKANQEVRFELVFRSASDPFVDRKVIESDSGVCKMKINANDNRFWTMTAEDGYYKCDSSETCGQTNVAWATFPTPDKIQTNSKNYWTTPIVDNDVNNPMCVPFQSTELGADPYKIQFVCKQITCVHQRPLVTNDAQDFQFYNVAKKKLDTMLLPRVRSNVAIDFATATPTVMFAVFDAPKSSSAGDYSITIVNGATTLGQTIAVAAAIAYTLF